MVNAIQAEFDDEKSKQLKSRLVGVGRESGTHVDELAGQFQVIVCDHLDLTDEWFSDAVRERWGAVKLIPTSWSRDSPLVWSSWVATKLRAQVGWQMLASMARIDVSSMFLNRAVPPQR